MSKTFYPAGYVLTGKYEGKHIYKEYTDSFMIVSGDSDNKIVTDSIFATVYDTLKSISIDTVTAYEDVSSAHHGPNLSSVAGSAFWFGAAGALVSAAVSQSDTYDIALEFSDGDKFMIRLTSASHYQAFKRIFFEVPTITQKSSLASPSSINQNAPSQAAPLLERAYIFLEDGDFSKADEYIEKVLDLEPKNASAYIVKLLIDLKVKDQADLSKQATPNILTENPNFIKAHKYGDEKLVSELDAHVNAIKNRIKSEEESTPQGKYKKATELLATAVTSDDFLKAANIFQSLNTYKDANVLAAKCIKNAEIAKKDAILASAKKQQERNDIKGCNEAIILFKSIPGWKDADEQLAKCKELLSALKEKEEKERIERQQAEEAIRIANENKKRKKKKRILTITISLVAFLLIAFFVIYPGVSYLTGHYSPYINIYNVKEFEVPEGVTVIDYRAFYKCDSLTAVVIPDSVTCIRGGAFYDCENLTSITFSGRSADSPTITEARWLFPPRHDPSIHYTD